MEHDTDLLTVAAEMAGRAYGMTGEQYLQNLAIGDVPHPDAPATDCGATNPRDDTTWCKLSPEHPGEGHNRYAPPAPYRTWIEWEAAQ